MRIAKLILNTLLTLCILGLVAGGMLYFHLKSELPSVETLKPLNYSNQCRFIRLTVN